MAGKRKQHTAAFKVQVALAALKGDRTVGELAGEYDRVYPDGSSWVSGCWIWCQATRAPTNAPRRALPLLRVLWMNWKNPR